MFPCKLSFSPPRCLRKGGVRTVETEILWVVDLRYSCSRTRVRSPVRGTIERTRDGPVTTVTASFLGTS